MATAEQHQHVVLRTLSDAAPFGMALWRTNSEHLEYVNPALALTLDRDVPELLAGELFACVHPGDQADMNAVLARCNAQGAYMLSARSDVRFVRPDNTVVWTDVTTSTFDNADGVTFCLMLVLDNTATRQSEHRLEYHAMHDGLTGLPNRSLLVDRLDLALARNTRDRATVAVFHVDIDDFKGVNDSLGHISGDQLIRVVADRLRSALRPGDTIARVAGDEFVIVAEVDSVARCAVLTQSIRSVVSSPLELGRIDRPHVVHPSVSIGLAVSTGTAVPPNASTLLRDADTAMHEAKSQGRGQIAFFTDSLRERLRRRVDTEADLRLAVERDQIVPFFQPIVNLDTGQIIKAESLVRWEHPSGLRFPKDFLGVAQDCGLMVEIGDELTRAALRFAAMCRRYIPDFSVSVNLAVSQISRPDLQGVVESFLDEVELPPSALEFEITESAYSEAMESDATTLQQLSDFGVALSLDDFGTGWSSLERARTYPVNGMKIDQVFTRGIEGEIDRGIITVLVKLARVLRMRTTLEGVETVEQFRIARSIGVTFAQGYYVAPALPAKAFEELLKKGQVWG